MPAAGPAVGVWAHYLGGRQGYPRRLNGVRLTVNDTGVDLDGPYRTRFLVAWGEINHVNVEPTAEESTMVTRLVKKGRGSSLPVSKPASAFFHIHTSANEIVRFAVAGVTLGELKHRLRRWVDFEDDPAHDEARAGR